MKTRSQLFFKLSVLFLFMLTLAACGKSDDTDPEAPFVPDLSATWFNQADASNTNTFFFLVDSLLKNSSTFIGNENPAGGGAQLHFTGSFTNKNISFTYDAGGAKAGKSYSGTINDSSKVMTLSSTTLGPLVLRKN